MRRLLVRPAVRTDLFEIADHIAADNPARALSFVDEIEALFTRIADMPERFAARDDLAKGLRIARHGRHLVLFETDTEEVRIIRVLHGARDLPRVLGPIIWCRRHSEHSRSIGIPAVGTQRMSARDLEPGSNDGQQDFRALISLGEHPVRFFEVVVGRDGFVRSSIDDSLRVSVIRRPAPHTTAPVPRSVRR